MTLVILALEILRIDKVASSWSIRNKPYLLTFAFGLIHGCGFASVLADALSSEADLMIPLLAFNAGIEVGQLIIILVGFWAARLLTATGLRCTPKTAAMLIAYPMGALSGYWLMKDC